MIVSEGISQGSSDTVCLPVSQVNKAIIEIEKGKVVAEELALTKKKADTLSERLKVKDFIIGEFKQKELMYNSIITDYKKVIDNQNSLASNLQQMIDLSEKKYRREKINKWLTLLLAVGGAYLVTR